MNYGHPKIESCWIVRLELDTQWKTFTYLGPGWGFGRGLKVHQQVVWGNTTFYGYLYGRKNVVRFGVECDYQSHTLLCK